MLNKDSIKVYWLAVVACFVCSLSFVPQLVAEKPLPKKIIVILIDTLRADHLPMYGYERNTSEFLNELAKKSVVFEHAISPASYTAPATASIHTALLPEQHGVLLGMKASRKVNKLTGKSGVNRIPDKALTIAEFLKSLNYSTFGIADNGNISEDMGFTQGFDRFTTFSNKGANKVAAELKKYAPEIKKSEKYFLYLHYMDPHGPFLKHAPWYEDKTSSSENAVVRAYNSEIGFVDHHISKVFKEFELDKDSIVLITSDHGEEFWEHGKQGHGKTLYSEVLHVPWIMYAPERLSPIRYEPAVSTVDIFPTLVGLLGLQQLPEHAGIDLVPSLKAGDKHSRAIASTLFRQLNNGREISMKAVTRELKRAIRREDGSWKDPSEATSVKKKLFDLKADPEEKNNLAKAQKDTFTELLGDYQEIHKHGKTFNREFSS